jgi:DNA-binding CsgD family transcriptional regulator
VSFDSTPLSSPMIDAMPAPRVPLSLSANPITPAELRVLRYMTTHLNYAEIAQELSVSRNTVKTHAISTYRKLGVSSRSAAVVAARHLGLLDATVRQPPTSPPRRRATDAPPRVLHLIRSAEDDADAGRRDNSVSLTAQERLLLLRVLADARAARSALDQGPANVIAAIPAQHFDALVSKLIGNPSTN